MNPLPEVLFYESPAATHSINNKTFEDIVLPSWLEIVDALDKADIDVAFHCDSDWTRFLPYFKEFPRGRCILQLDGATDIYKAKEILNGHMAIQGDVPASLLTLGTPEQVYDYCKQIIEAIGKDGGFILSSGCSTPFDSKFEMSVPCFSRPRIDLVLAYRRNKYLVILLDKTIRVRQIVWRLQ